MPDYKSIKNDFLLKVTLIIEKNIPEEGFGVSELASEINMSRSNLLRKIKKLTGLSVSQYIRKIRLKEGMNMLKEQSLTVSEISYAVGFGSTSYFIKCFHDHYGYPPGEVVNKVFIESDTDNLDHFEKELKTKQSSFDRFWQELKRRKVVKVIIVYASISFIILQLLSILIEPLFLPQWIMTVVVVLLAIGFPISIIFSWIFDFTHKGFEVTKSIGENEIFQTESSNKKKSLINSAFIIILLSIVGILSYPKLVGNNDEGNKNSQIEKSIAVLPFKNDSNDSSNVYIINGLMESVLNNLQKIEDLRVISRTSVEKYRNNSKTIPEISEELNVSYFIEGSGQKIGEDILLNIQLIEASTDKHLWAQHYKRNANDIFALQQEVAKNIADKIEVIITPEEKEMIETIPTDNLTAYDYFLRGLDLLHSETRAGLIEAIPYFKKAIEYDPEFSQAYADIAISYYYLDILKSEKLYSEQIKKNADKALEYDSKSAQGLLAKAMYYLNIEENEMALPYFEKALEYNPNSAIINNYLSDYYTNYMPNTEKYLEYALKGIGLDIGAKDSITASFTYLHLSNAFIQAGFVKEAEMYIEKSISFNPNNLYSKYVKAYILYAKTKDLAITKELLLKAYSKDMSRLDILHEIGKICYYMNDYKEAYIYYSKFIEIKEAQELDIYPHENIKIGLVFKAMGQLEKAEQLVDEYKVYADNDKSIYKNLSLAMYFIYTGETKEALEYLELFTQEDNYVYWIPLFLENDPLVDNIKDNPEFKQLLEDIENKFWKKHQLIKNGLEEKDLI